MQPLTHSEIHRRPSTELSTRLAEICLETIDAQGNPEKIKALHAESNSITHELHFRRDKILEAACY